jgi:hypothetical protein
LAKQIKTPLDVYKLLPKSNCRQCSLPTCIAFSAAVLRGEKEIEDCPNIDKSLAGEAKRIDRPVSVAQRREEAADQLRSQIPSIDFHSSAGRLGGRITEDKLVLKCLGKDFFIDPVGTITSECHTHAWVSLFLLDYIINSPGKIRPADGFLSGN